MNVCNYSRSFATFVLRHVNTARLQLEGRCVLRQADGSEEQFLMFASCKSEDTYAEKDLFRNPETQPNYDFSGVFASERYSLNRIYVSSEGEMLETGLIKERFSYVVRHVREVPEARALTTKQAVIEATLSHQVVIARTEVRDEASGMSALMEFPVKTMNVNPERGMFQIDTGPLPYYDFDDPDPEIMARVKWAYCAYNEFQGAYFIIQAPTAIVRDGVEVAQRSHYQRIVHRAEARNTLFAYE
jgi:hypothetical protein